jgi:hypothetical protein
MRWLLSAALLVQIGCVAPIQIAGSGGKTDRIVTIDAVVTRFGASAMHDDFADGRHDAYDLTVLTIVGPGPYRGKTLEVMHAAGATPAAFWPEVGRRCPIAIDRRLLGDSVAQVSGAAIVVKCGGDGSFDR